MKYTKRTLIPFLKKFGANLRSFPSRINVHLATRVENPPNGDEWIHELKYDGYRLLVMKQKDRITLMTRQGSDWTARFKDILPYFSSRMNRDFILDGEICVTTPSGITDFQHLQNYLNGTSPGKLCYYAFDILYVDGYDTRSVPLLKRKQILSKFFQGMRSRRIGMSAYTRGEGEAAIKAARTEGLEGIVSKRVDSTYVSGRTLSWVKSKCAESDAFIVVGFTLQKAAAHGIGALLLAYYEDNQLRYCGNVGTGFSHNDRRQLLNYFSLQTTTKPPVENITRLPGAHWIKPTMIVQVEFTEWTSESKLRHPVFKGLREDLKSHQIHKEEPTNRPVV